VVPVQRGRDDGGVALRFRELAQVEAVRQDLVVVDFDVEGDGGDLPVPEDDRTQSSVRAAVTISAVMLVSFTFRTFRENTLHVHIVML
jgi:hypothetical protein